MRVLGILFSIIWLLSPLELNGQDIYADTVRDALTASLGENYSKAIEIASKAIEIDPTDPWAFGVRGNALDKLGRKEEAIVEYTSSIMRGGKAFYKRGKMKFDLGDYRGAIRDINTAIDQDPNSNNVDPQFSLNEVYGVTQLNYKRWVYHITSYHYYRGSSYFNLGEYRAAISDFTAIIELTPEEFHPFYDHAGLSLYNRGHARILIGEINKGCLDLSKAGEIGVSGSYKLIRENC